MAALVFWYEFASTYSYPAAMAIEARARKAGVVVEWRPILLGPIFGAQGWKDSPFNIYPAKGKYMWRDMARICAAEGLKFSQPQPFPQNSLLAARIAAALEGPTRVAFSQAVYMAEFADGRPISAHETLGNILSQLGLDAAALFERAASDEVKAALKANVEAAVRAGVFGAPSFTTADGELFWGFDRLDQALDWARR
jgi:2-hydroxychromene-2-carboxylate isomerase